MANDGRSPRRFTIGDGMVLIAALAMGLGVSSQVGKETLSLDGNRWGRAWQTVILGVILISPCLFSLTIAIIALGLKAPRPRWRRVSRRPGMTACLSALLPLILLLPFYIGLVIREYVRGQVETSTFWSKLPIVFLEIFSMGLPIMGSAVLLAWILSLVQRLCRCEPSWNDRAGRLLGVVWIASGAIVVVEFTKDFLR